METKKIQLIQKFFNGNLEIVSSKGFSQFCKTLMDEAMRRFNLLEEFKQAVKNLEGIFDYNYVIQHGDLHDQLFKLFFEFSERTFQNEYQQLDQTQNDLYLQAERAVILLIEVLIFEVDVLKYEIIFLREIDPQMEFNPYSITSYLENLENIEDDDFGIEQDFQEDFQVKVFFVESKTLERGNIKNGLGFLKNLLKMRQK